MLQLVYHGLPIASQMVVNAAAGTDVPDDIATAGQAAYQSMNSQSLTWINYSCRLMLAKPNLEHKLEKLPVRASEPALQCDIHQDIWIFGMWQLRQ